MINRLLAYIIDSKAGKGIGAVKDFLKAKKTYALGSLTIFQGIVGIWGDLAGLPDTTALIDFAKGFNSNPDWKMILAGIAMFTIRAAIAKTAPISGRPGYDDSSGGV